MGQLTLNVWRCEDGLEVHQVFLAGHPLLQGVTEEVQLLVHSLYLIADAHHKPEKLNFQATPMSCWRVNQLVTPNCLQNASCGHMAVLLQDAICNNAEWPNACDISSFLGNF